MVVSWIRRGIKITIRTEKLPSTFTPDVTTELRLNQISRSERAEMQANVNRDVYVSRIHVDCVLNEISQSHQVKTKEIILDIRSPWILLA